MKNTAGIESSANSRHMCYLKTHAKKFDIRVKDAYIHVPDIGG